MSDIGVPESIRYRGPSSFDQNQDSNTKNYKHNVEDATAKYHTVNDPDFSTG